MLRKLLYRIFHVKDNTPLYFDDTVIDDFDTIEEADDCVTGFNNICGRSVGAAHCIDYHDITGIISRLPA